MYGFAYVAKKASELLPCPGLERSGRAGKNDRRRIKRLRDNKEMLTESLDEFSGQL